MDKETQLASQASILVCDDDPYILASIKRITFGNYAIDTAQTAAEALAKINTQEYAVIITDLTIPQTYGLDLIKVAHRIKPDTVNIILTGRHEAEHAIKACNEGYIFQYLTKPCSTPKFLSVLDCAINKYLENKNRSHAQLLDSFQDICETAIERLEQKKLVMHSPD